MKFGRCKIGILGLIYVIPCFLIWFSDRQSFAAENTPEKTFFSIQADNETLRSVLKKISTASGYEIRFNTHLADEKIRLRLDNVTLNEALSRLLKPYNHISLWDDANHIVTLLIFQKNRPPVTLSGVNRIFELATETTAGQ